MLRGGSARTLLINRATHWSSGMFRSIAMTTLAAVSIGCLFSPSDGSTTLPGAAPAGASDTLFVDAQAPPGGDGSSWGTAFNDLQLALDAALRTKPAVDQIWIAEGTYLPSVRVDDNDPRSVMFHLEQELSLLGGFAGSESSPDERNVADHPTILSGDLQNDDGPDFANRVDNAYHIMWPDSLASLELDGLTFRGGNADDSGQWPVHWPGFGGAIQGIVSSLVLRDCTFTDCQAAGLGSAIHIGETGTSAIVENCSFTGNVGGCAFLFYATGTVTITDSVFINNETPNFGGGVYIRASLDISNCVFEGNVANIGGGIHVLLGETANISNCTFSGNTGRAIDVGHTTGSIVGCTFTANTGGASAFESATIEVSDCDFVLNTLDDDDGAAIFSRECEIEIRDCLFHLNHAVAQGGAIAHLRSTTTTANCLFLSNTSGADGAIFNERGQGDVITDCTFVANDIGIYNIESDPDILRCTFSAQASTTSGSAVRSVTGSAPTFTDCMFLNNTSVRRGGAVFTTISGPDDFVRFTRCQFISNTAVEEGGAIYHTHIDLELHDCLFVGNTAGEDGGAMFLEDVHQPLIENSVFYGNTTNERGGGLYIRAFSEPQPNPNIVSSILWLNAANGTFDEAAQIYDDTVTTSTVRFSCIQGLDTFSGSGNTGQNPDMVDPDGADGVIGTLDDNLHLRPTSPCVNRGDVLAPDGEIDLDGAARVQQCRVDMGPYESPYAAPIMIDCNNNGMPDECDIQDGISPDCNRNGIPDECDVASGAVEDCNRNGIPDECDVMEEDCNGNGIPDECDVAMQDCNGNGIPDECDAALVDCNGNGIPDECDIASGSSLDCNQNGFPDECDIAVSVTFDSGELAPFDADNPHRVTIAPLPPPTGDVIFAIEANAELDFGTEEVEVYGNGVLLGILYRDGLDCPQVSTGETITVPAEQFAALLVDNALELLLVATPAVGACAPSYVRVRMDLPLTPYSDDADCNGIPDECECLGDCGGGPDGVVDVRDLLAVLNQWGTEGTCDFSCDRIIGCDDLLIVLANWGACPAP